MTADMGSAKRLTSTLASFDVRPKKLMCWPGSRAPSETGAAYEMIVRAAAREPWRPLGAGPVDVAPVNAAIVALSPSVLSCCTAVHLPGPRPPPNTG